MKRLIRTIPYAAVAVAFLAAPAPVAAAEITPEQRAAYLACYRRVLTAPEFALADPVELYRIREDRLAKAVIMACPEEIRPYGVKLLEDALRSPDPGDGTARPKDWLFAAYESGLRRQVAADLVEAAPRVKPLADADPGSAAGE